MTAKLQPGCGGEGMNTFPLTRGSGQNNEIGGCLLRYCKTITVATFALSMLGMVASCGEKPASLEKRVKAYWEARVKGQAEKSFEIEVPGTLDKPTYLKRILTAPVTFTSYSIQAIKENGNEAVVELQTEYLLPGLSRPVSSSMLDKWMRMKGQWYHHLPVGDDGTSAERR